MRLESTCKPRKGLGLFASLFASQLSFQLSTLSSLVCTNKYSDTSFRICKLFSSLVFSLKQNLFRRNRTTPKRYPRHHARRIVYTARKLLRNFIRESLLAGPANKYGGWRSCAERTGEDLLNSLFSFELFDSLKAMSHEVICPCNLQCNFFRKKILQVGSPGNTSLHGLLPSALIPPAFRFSLGLGLGIGYKCVQLCRGLTVIWSPR